MCAMISKVTRRVVLGSIVIGLAGGMTLLRRSRNKPLPWPNLSAYGHDLKIELAEDETDLSPAEVNKAFDVLLEERDMWLRFRGLSAGVRVTTSKRDQNWSREGGISLRLTDSPSSPQDPRRCYEYELEYLSPERDEVHWTYVEGGSGPRFSGTRTEGAEPETLFDILTAPVHAFCGLSNPYLRTQRGVWNPYVNRAAKGVPNSYVFKGLDMPPYDAQSQIVFQNAHVSEIRSKKEAGRPVTVMRMMDHVEANGVWFPAKLKVNALDDVQNTFGTVTVELSGLNTVVA